MHETNTSAYWTPERKVEHTIRGNAHLLCLKGEFMKARELMKEKNLKWPPWKNTPVQTPGRSTACPPGKADGRAAVARINGKLGGAPSGEGNGAYNSTKLDPVIVIEEMKKTLLSGGTEAIKTNPYLRDINIKDRESIIRVCNMTAEEFNAKLSDELGQLAAELTASLRKDLANGKLRPGEKAFPLAISIDKRAVLDGRSAVQGANVQIQVNQFNGPISRDELMARLAPVNAAPKPVLPPDPSLPPA